MRILSVDPGDKNIGLALSDPTGTIASPLKVIKHVSRDDDARKIASIAKEHQVVLIVVGQALDVDGQPSLSGRKAARLAGAIRSNTEIPVLLWDESNSTQIAKQARLALGSTRKKRKGHLDDLAAVVILQSYLDTQRTSLDQ